VPLPAGASALNEKDRSILMLREGEELRRRAFFEHATEKLALGDRAFVAKDFTAAQRYYNQAVASLEEAGERPENRVQLERARQGAMESMYLRGVKMMKDGDLDNALKLADEASQLGHPEAADLVGRINKALEKPEPPPPPEKPRWNQSEYLQKQKEVTERMTQGREHYIANELDKAQAMFESVLRDDPDNTEALRWREKVTQARYERASMELETTRIDMVRQVRDAWNPRDYGVGLAPRTEKDKGPREPIRGETDQDRILKKMDGITIPEIDFRQANIQNVIEFLQDQSIEWDRSGDDPRGVNLILNLGAVEAAPVAAQPADEWGFAPAPEPSAAPAGTQLITFRAREISLLQALKIVTDVANLKYRIEGNVVMVLPFNAADSKIIHRMYDVLPTVGERISQVRAAAAAEERSSDFIAIGGGDIDQGATDWKQFFSELGVKWPLSSSIKYVPAIGKLMVANTADNLAVFEQRLAALNIVPKQIEIEARFVEVNQTDLNSLGFEFLLTDDWEVAQKRTDADLPLAQRQRLVVGAGEFSSGQRFVTDNAGDAEAPQDLATARDDILRFASVLTNPELAVVLHALEQKGHTDLLSAPKVTTQNGVEAQIKVVTEYIYPSDYTIEPGITPTLNADGSVQTAGTPPVVTPAEFETREVGVILSVLPEVSTEGEMISLTMSPEVVTEPTWRNYGQEYTDAAGNLLQIPIEQPFFHTRSISTSILIYNGATVVMGGMITEERQQVDDKIPFLGDLPLLGRLFQSKYDRSVKRNLLIFVTARLVDPAGRPVGSAQQSTALESILQVQAVATGE
jgi:general secretion pathway protein D